MKKPTKMKTTKEKVIKENSVLEARIKHLEAEDLRVRKVLSDMLGSYEFSSSAFYAREKVICVKSWEGIAFMIGELKADADYACCIKAREDLRREVDRLLSENRELKNPDEKKIN